MPGAYACNCSYRMKNLAGRCRGRLIETQFPFARLVQEED